MIQPRQPIRGHEIAFARPLDLVASLAGLGRSGDDLIDRFDGHLVLRTMRLDEGETLVPYDERVIGDRVVEQRRSISDDDKYVIKHICIRGSDKEYVERVRLFEAGDLSYMLSAAGFKVTSSFGNYDATPLTHESPRVILFGTRM